MLFDYLFTDNLSREEIRGKLNSSNKMLDTLISKYESTYLVKEETNYLEHLKENLKTFERDETLLINAAIESKDLAKNLYLNTTLRLYDELDKDLLELTRVQSEIGNEFVKSQSSSDFISQLQIIVAIILGVIIMILIITDKQVVLKQEKYNLN